MSPYTPSPAVSVGGGGRAASAGLLSVGSRPADTCWQAHLLWAAQPQTFCQTNSGGPTGSATGTAIINI